MDQSRAGRYIESLQPPAAPGLTGSARGHGLFDVVGHVTQVGSALSQLARAAGVEVYGTSSPARRARADIAALVEHLATGALRPEVTTLPLDRAAEAHRRLENREVDGKLVLVP